MEPRGERRALRHEDDEARIEARRRRSLVVAVVVAAPPARFPVRVSVGAGEDVSGAVKVHRRLLGVRAAHASRHGPEDALHPCEHGGDGVVLQEHVAREDFRQNAAQRPNVNLGIVWQAEQNFGCAVRPRLDVRGGFIGRKTRAPKVDELDGYGFNAGKDDVLRFHVAVRDAQRVHVLQGDEALSGDSRAIGHIVKHDARVARLPRALVQVLQQQVGDED
mmetsp:Transcript_24321/g.82007  ORF Transcript_24321/g.82007 Transcript_24321/m.82007 type:complete len:220 (-) Transcript_24321:501-1160(-)